MNLLSKARNEFLGKRSAAALGIFRIVYGCVLFGEVLELLYFRRLVFGDLPFLQMPELSFAFVLWLWAAAVGCMILGFHTRIACVVNYVLTVATLSTFKHYEYHADHIYIGLNLLLIFTPVEKRFSLDALLARLRSGVLPGAPAPDTSVARFHYQSLLIVGLALVYFDSFFWKLSQEIWTSGLGVWLPMSLPHNTWFSVSVLNSVLNRQWLMSLLSDLTLVFEATFIALMWVRAARPFLCVIGVGMHLSIVFAFPIPFFGLSLAAMYLLLAPESWYEAAGRVFRRGEPGCLVFFDANSARWRRRLLVLEYFDFRRNLAFHPVAGSDPTSKLAGGLLMIEEDRQYSGHHAFRAAMQCHPLLWPLAGIVSTVVERRDRKDGLVSAAARPARTLTAVDRDALVLSSAAAHESARQQTTGATDEPAAFGRARLTGRPSVAGRLEASLIAKFAIVAGCAVVQATLITKAPCFKDSETTAVAAAPPRWLAKLQKDAHGFLGLCSHGVFLDGHFKNFDHVVAVTLVRPDGSETWLPLTEPTGQMGSYATGRIWAKWAFRGNAPYMSIEHLKLTLRDLTGFWARKNDVNLADARFKVLVKKYDPQSGWERNFLLRQTEKPWSLAGWVVWQGGNFSAEITNIEAL